MPAIPQEELELLIADIESDRVERKESFTSASVRQKAMEAICAFANDLPDHRTFGLLVIGVTDGGIATGLDVDDQLLTTIGGFKLDGRILPPPSITVEKREYQGKSVAVVCVQPSDAPPVRFDGRVWIRIGPRRGIATLQDERILNEKRRHLDRSYDSRPISGCSIDDLNQRTFEEIYLPQAIAADILEKNGRSYLERLAATGMVASADEPTPTLVGILTIGISPRDWIPGAYIQFLRFSGTELTDPISDSSEIDGDLDTIMRRLDEKMRANIAVAVNFTSGTVREIRRPNYPLTALQQLTRNAVMHRVYEHTHAPIRINWFDDRIEISSPGGPYGIVNRENFGRPGFGDYRNPNIATAMKNLGYVQRFGIGIAEARRALKENGNSEPEFEVDESFVFVTIRKSE